MTGEMTTAKTLPPPYTASGAQSNSLRTDASHFTSTAELIVGQKATPFLIHTTLLVSQSPYFRAALEGPFLEATTRTITLPDISVEHFELVISWLYTGDILPIPFKDGKPAYYTLLHLYMVADRLCLEGLRNRVVDLMADLADSTNSVLTPSDTRILYDLLPENAPIRRLVLDLFAFKKTDKLLEEHEDRWHAAFLRDLCVLLKRPCRQALLRHRLVMWFPPSVGHWKGVLACDHCRNVLEKRRGAVRCEECGVGWCGRCVGEGVGMATWEDGNVGRVGRATRWSVGGSAGSSGDEGNVWEDAASTAVSEGGSSGGSGSARGVKKVRFRKWQSCKPWRGARCAIYHEHRETARCEDVLMGLAGNVS